MKVSIVSASIRDCTYIAANMRAEDWREITAVAPFGATEIGATLWAGSEGLRWVALLDDAPVCAFGVLHVLPGLGSGWAYGTKRMRIVMPVVTRFCRRVAAPQLVREGFRRVEVRTAIDHDISHRWLESLGFVAEGVAVDYGANGLDFITYAATRSRRYEQIEQRGVRHHQRTD